MMSKLRSLSSFYGWFILVVSIVVGDTLPSGMRMGMGIMGVLLIHSPVLYQYPPRTVRESISPLSCLLLLRLVWQTFPGIVSCALFWGLTPLALLFFGERKEPSKGWLPLVVGSLYLLGFISNAVVTLANGGFMPVVGGQDSISIWIVSTESQRLLFLADRFMGFSLGDLFLLGGVAVTIIDKAIRWLARPNKRVRTEQVLTEQM